MSSSLGGREAVSAGGGTCTNMDRRGLCASSPSSAPGSSSCSSSPAGSHGSTILIMSGSPPPRAGPGPAPNSPQAHPPVPHPNAWEARAASDSPDVRNRAAHDQGMPRALFVPGTTAGPPAVPAEAVDTCMASRSHMSRPPTSCYKPVMMANASSGPVLSSSSGGSSSRPGQRRQRQQVDFITILSTSSSDSDWSGAGGDVGVGTQQHLSTPSTRWVRVQCAHMLLPSTQGLVGLALRHDAPDREPATWGVST